MCLVDRSAKKLSAELKEALKTRDPWEKEVAFLRNKLSAFRNLYWDLALIQDNLIM